MSPRRRVENVSAITTRATTTPSTASPPGTFVLDRALTHVQELAEPRGLVVLLRRPGLALGTAGWEAGAGAQRPTAFSSWDLFILDRPSTPWAFASL